MEEEKILRSLTVSVEYPAKKPEAVVWVNLFKASMLRTDHALWGAEEVETAAEALLGERQAFSAWPKSKIRSRSRKFPKATMGAVVDARRTKVIAVN